jgi:hypothetical protein
MLRRDILQEHAPIEVAKSPLIGKADKKQLSEVMTVKSIKPKTSNKQKSGQANGCPAYAEQPVVKALGLPPNMRVILIKNESKSNLLVRSKKRSINHLRSHEK